MTLCVIMRHISGLLCGLYNCACKNVFYQSRQFVSSHGYSCLLFAHEVGRFVLINGRAVFPFEQVISILLWYIAISVLRVSHFSSLLNSGP